MRQFFTMILGSVFAITAMHAIAVELELDPPISPDKRGSEVQPPSPPDNTRNKDKLQRPAHPGTGQKTPTGDIHPPDRTPPAIDPDAEQVNRGAVSPQ